MIVVPFITAHLEGFEVIKEQYQEYINEDFAHVLASTIAYSAVVDDKVIAVGGLLRLGFERYQAWALMSNDTAKHMVAITREVKRFLGMFDARIEIAVKDNFKAGHKWADMLGFKCETPNGMPRYEQGETYYLYARY
jgi:hypothetical protein